jgi:hypothetical protein
MRSKLTTTDHVDAIYVVGGATLAIGAQHAAHYATETNLGDTGNAQPEESIAFTYAITPGPPPALHVEAGASTVSPSRIKGLLSPARDPWLVARICRSRSAPPRRRRSSLDAQLVLVKRGDGGLAARRWTVGNGLRGAVERPAPWRDAAHELSAPGLPGPVAH